VPYWSFGKTIDSHGFDSLIYFGAGVTENGLDPKDRGYQNLPKFVDITSTVNERILAIRMVDKNINASVIKSLTAQENIATQAVALAQQYGFTGILLDYETSAFAFDSTTKNVSSFYKLFSEKVHSKNLIFYVALYGDTYFRARAYDIKKIGSLSDKVFVMAYDFSKSSGNPGPDFPLVGREQYGYDFSKMVDDYQKDVPNNKLIVTLGYFGYDWRVDAKDNAVAAGIPLTTSEITKEFVAKCGFKQCDLKRNQADEPAVKYIDDSGEGHIIWFEDETSINRKKEFLKTKGIQSTAAWAYSYY